jgi:hypothetical protein
MIIEAFSYNQAAWFCSSPPPWTTYGTLRAAIFILSDLKIP